jgi:hypothetical protein
MDTRTPTHLPTRWRLRSWESGVARAGWFNLGKFNRIDHLFLPDGVRQALGVGAHDGFVVLTMTVNVEASAAKPSRA